MITLRDYQSRAVDNVLGGLEGGARSVCLVAPTGAGKTRMGSALVQHFVRQGRRVLWVAHRVELVKQAVDSLGVPCGLVVAGSPKWAADGMPCVVGSLQTLARRDVPPVDLIFVDEAHHIMSKTYQRLLERLPGAQLVGLTATPCRLDGKPLGSVFQSLQVAAKVSDLIEQGHLVKPRVFTTPAEPDLGGVKKTAGDFNEQQLEEVCNTTTLRGDIVRHWQERSAGKPTVLFAVSLEHSRALVEDFARVGVKAVHVDGEMGKVERDAALLAVRSGQAKILCNVGIVTEGWDFPQLETCIFARPTASLSLVLQMVGRVMRPWPGKDALVLDHAGNFLRHQVLPWTDIDWTLDVARKQAKPGSLKNCPACFSIMPSGVQACASCGHVFERKQRERGEVTTDNAAQLSEVTSLEALLVNQYLERRKEPLKPYTQKLVDQVRAGKVREDFLPFLRRAKGSVGKAAYEYKQACGRWP